MPWTGNDAVARLSSNRTSGVVRHGNELDNVLAGTSGDDYFRGAEGNDRLIGGQGMDTYVFEIGDGRDTIDDQHGPNVLMFLASVAIDGITADRGSDGSSLVISYGPSETITIEQFDASGDWFIESSCGGDARPLRTLIRP